jgi:hypothetical protein
VIKIREAFPGRKALFDIAVAGPRRLHRPRPAAVLGACRMSNVQPVPPDMHGYALGEPLLFKLATWLKFGHIPDGYSVEHPSGRLRRVVRHAGDRRGTCSRSGSSMAAISPTRRSAIARSTFSLATVGGLDVMCFITYSWV